MVPANMKFSVFGSKSAFGPKLEAGVDATILEESYATTISSGSATMSKKFNDFDFLFGRHPFCVCCLQAATADLGQRDLSVEILF